MTRSRQVSKPNPESHSPLTKTTPAKSKTADPATVIAQMAKLNPIYQHLGVELIDAQPGFSRFAMNVRPELGNTFQYCHGGILFTLADLAFGFTCNATGEKAVTASVTIDYLSPVPINERLIAEAREIARNGRNVYYTVHIKNRAEEQVALIHGRMRIIGGPVIENT